MNPEGRKGVTLYYIGAKIYVTSQRYIKLQSVTQTTNQFGRISVVLVTVYVIHRNGALQQRIIVAMIASDSVETIHS